MYPANTHLTQVIGVDIHSVNLPVPTPVPHPYIGIVFDPFDYTPFVGSTVSINGVPRGNTDTIGSLLTKIHIPLGAGFTTPPLIAHQSHNYFGSIKVQADGAPLSGAGYQVMTCNDVGAPLSPSPDTKMAPGPFLYLPSSSTVPVPMGPPVMVGGPMAPNFSMAAAMKAHIMDCFAKLSGAALKKALTKLNHEVLKKFPGTKKLGDQLCHMGFEPVDLITGRVSYEYTDFELPGPIPICWERVWDSDSQLKGALGYATHLSYDRHIQLFPEDAAAVLLLADGRGVAFPFLQPGENFYHPTEKFTVTRKQNGHFTVQAHQEKLYYQFNYVPTSAVYKLSLIEDYSGHRIQLHYAGRYLSAITDSAGRQLLLTLNQDGCITEVLLLHKGEREILVKYGYNENGDLTRIADALNQSTDIEYSDDHLMVKKTDRNGQAFYWDYDNQRRCIHTWGDGGILEGWLTYQNGYNIIRDSLNESTTYYYNADNLCTQKMDGYGNSKYFQYTLSNQIFREIDEEGNVTGYTYDDYERLKEIVQPDGTSTIYQYNDRHQPILITFPNSATQTFVYDERKRIACINYPNGSYTAYEYNIAGLLQTILSKGGTATGLEYDEDANLVKMLMPGGTVLSWRYDARGRCIESLNSEGQRKVFKYDLLDRVTNVRLPDGNHIQLEYNAYEEVTRASDKKGSVQFEYTPMGLLQKRIQNNTQLEFHYNTEQRLTYISNEANKIYRFGYNQRGEITKEIGFDGIGRLYERDKAGKVIKTLRPGGRSTAYEYDLNGNIIRTEYHDGSWEIFNYDKNGSLKEAVNQFSTVRLKRNKSGLVEEEWQDDYSVESRYDQFGDRIHIHSSLGADIEQERDKSGNVTFMKAKIDELLWQSQMKYNKAGQEIERLLPGNISSQWRYDEAGRPAEHLVKKGAELLRWKKYTWEADDQLTRIFDSISNATTQFRHDDFGNLVWAQYADNTIIHREADVTGNLYETPEKNDRKYGSGGQLLESKRCIYKYDEEGNLISKTDKHTQTKWRYEWYANGMLQKVTRPDSKEVVFKYDALGRRTEKSFDKTITRWVWDGNVPLHEWQYAETLRPKPVVNEWGELSYDREEPSANITTWLFDPETFVPAAKIKDGQSFSIVCDYLGTPHEMYDAAGKKVWEGVLDIYGRVITLKGEKSAVPFRYQGQYEDIETGLYYNRFRYYDCEVGGYTSKDPIGLRGMNPNEYAYVKDTNIWTDFFGLDCKSFRQKDTITKRWANRLTGENADDMEAMMVKKGFKKSHPQAGFPDKIQHIRYTRTTKNGNTYILDYHPGGNINQKNQHGNDYWKVYKVDTNGNEVVYGRIGHKGFKNYDLIKDSPVYVDGKRVN